MLSLPTWRRGVGSTSRARRTTGDGGSASVCRGLLRSGRACLWALVGSTRSHAARAQRLDGNAYCAASSMKTGHFGSFTLFWWHHHAPPHSPASTDRRSTGIQP